MKKICCKKCNLYFKNREDESDELNEKDLCWNCRHILKCLKLTMLALSSQMNREIGMNWDTLEIKKIKYRL